MSERKRRAKDYLMVDTKINGFGYALIFDAMKISYDLSVLNIIACTLLVNLAFILQYIFMLIFVAIKDA